MKTLQAVKDNCRIDHGDDGEEHWYWRGASSGGYPCITVPDFTRDPSGRLSTAQRGRRAVWHIITGQPIPSGHMVYNTCQEPTCINPACLKSGARTKYGRMLRMSGAWRTGVMRRLVSQQNAASLRKITPAMAAEILGSSELVRVLALRYGVHKSTISRYRAGKRAGVGGLFAGLMR